MKPRLCIRGHNNWRARKKRPQARYCLSCMRASSVAQDARWGDFPVDLLLRVAERIIYGKSFGGLDADDLVQEARLAIWKARRRWRKRKGVDWKAFGVTVGRRAMLDALRKVEHLRRRPHMPRVVVSSELVEAQVAVG